MPSFIDIATLTKRATITGQEEFQVSATEKVTSEQLAKFAQMLTGFSTINTTDGVINGESNLLEALQVLYKLSTGNGRVRLLNTGSAVGIAYCDEYLSGFAIDVESCQIYSVLDDTTFSGDYSSATDIDIVRAIYNGGTGKIAQLGVVSFSNWNNIYDNFYGLASPVGSKVKVVPVYCDLNGSIGPQSKAPYIGFAFILSSSEPYKVVYFVSDADGNLYTSCVVNESSSTLPSVTWNKLGSGGGVTTVVVSDFANPVELTSYPQNSIVPIIANYTGTANVPSAMNGHYGYGFAIVYSPTSIKYELCFSATNLLSDSRYYKYVGYYSTSGVSWRIAQYPILQDGIGFSANSFKNITIPAIPFSKKIRYTINGYTNISNPGDGNPGSYCFNCVYEKEMQDGMPNGMSGVLVVNGSLALAHMCVQSNYLDSGDSGNPYDESAYNQLQLIVYSSTANCIIYITSISMEEII